VADYTKDGLVNRIRTQNIGDTCLYLAGEVEAAFFDGGWDYIPKSHTLMSVLKGWMIDGSGKEYYMRYDEPSGNLSVRMIENR